MKYFQKSDLIITIAIIIIEAILIIIYFLLLSYSVISRRPIATVTFKERIANRRQVDGFHWQNIYNGSVLYEYDTIRTSSDSQATIRFLDGTEIEMYESSIVKLGGLTSEQIANLEAGSLSVSTATDKSKSISISGKILQLFENAKALTTGFASGSANVELKTGLASLKTDKSDVNLKSLQSVSLYENGNIGDVQNLHVLPLTPLSHKKFIKTKPDEKVVFTFVSDDVENVKLIISPDKNFYKVYKIIDKFGETDTKNVYTCSSQLPTEKIYWKLVHSSHETETMELSVYEVDGISQRRPYANSNIIQAVGEEKVNFTWDRVDGASSYNFELSRGDNFQNLEVKKNLKNTETQVALTEEGNYYWKVIPQYKYENINSKTEVITQKFTLTKTDELLAPKLIFPINNYSLNLAEIKATGFRFYWQDIAVAKEYIVNFYTENSNSPVETYNVSTNYLEIKPQNTKIFDSLGKIFWSVSYKTDEKILSQKSELSKESVKYVLNKTNNPIVLRTIFPKDNYAVAENLIQDLMFTWKNKTRLSTVVLIAQDPNFQNIIFQKTVNTNSFYGVDLKEGHYYWKVQTINNDGSVVDSSDIKFFNVISSLVTPKISQPQNNSIVPVLSDTVLNISWGKVPFSDYYEVSIYSFDENKTIKKEFLKETALTLPFNYAEGNYQVTIQAFALDTEEHTKNTSLATTHNFNLKDINFFELEFPTNQGKIPGEVVLSEGINFVWKTDPSLKSGNTLQIIERGKVIRSVKLNQNEINSFYIKDLKSGNYSWKVLSDFNGYKVESKEQNDFTVLPLKNIKRSQFFTEKQTSHIDVDYLKVNRSLHFEWSKSSLADYYILEIVDSSDNIILKKETENTFLNLSELNLFHKGNFVVKLKEVLLNESDGIIEVESDKFNFTIDLPSIQKPLNVINAEADYYGL